MVQAKSPKEDNKQMFDKKEVEGKKVFIQKKLEAEDTQEGITINAVGKGNLGRLIVRGLKNY